MTKLKIGRLCWMCLWLSLFLQNQIEGQNGKTSKFPFLKILYLQKPEGYDLFDFDKSKMSSLFMQIQQTAWGINCIWTDEGDLIAKIKRTIHQANQFHCFRFLVPNDVEEMKFMLDCDLPDYPVCIDADNRIGRLNEFSSDKYFLLDEA